MTVNEIHYEESCYEPVNCLISSYASPESLYANKSVSHIRLRAFVSSVTT